MDAGGGKRKIATTGTAASAASGPGRRIVHALNGSLHRCGGTDLLSPMFMTIRDILRVLVPAIVTSLVSRNVDNNDVPTVLGFNLVLLVYSTISLASNFLTKGFSTVTNTKFTGGLHRSRFRGIRNCDFAGVSHFSANSVVAQLAASIAGLRGTCSVVVHVNIHTPVVIVIT